MLRLRTASSLMAAAAAGESVSTIFRLRVDRRVVTLPVGVPAIVASSIVGLFARLVPPLA